MVVIFSIQDKIDALKHEVGILEDKYKSMQHDGGRYNTAAAVLKERIKELEFNESFRK